MAGLTAALLGVARRSGRAQDASPAASPAALPGAEQKALFVQVFAAGTWAPAPDEPGV